MTEFQMQLMVKVDTEDVIDAEEAKEHPDSGIEAFFIGDTVKMEVFEDE